uniref:(northern house mosquito) hypothetical protein n=1 Tax=Culex pipiens TaxID=7175 RepID=A0A8D8AX66_CULPI
MVGMTGCLSSGDSREVSERASGAADRRSSSWSSVSLVTLNGLSFSSLMNLVVSSPADFTELALEPALDADWENLRDSDSRLEARRAGVAIFQCYFAIKPLKTADFARFRCT